MKSVLSSVIKSNLLGFLLAVLLVWSFPLQTGHLLSRLKRIEFFGLFTAEFEVVSNAGLNPKAFADPNDKPASEAELKAALYAILPNDDALTNSWDAVDKSLRAYRITTVKQLQDMNADPFVTNTLTELYQTYLKRKYDAAGFVGWGYMLFLLPDNADIVEVIRASITASHECAIDNQKSDPAQRCY